MQWLTFDSYCTVYGGVAQSLASYQSSAWPVTISPTGATYDSAGNLNILVGQNFKPTILGIPSELLNNASHPPTYTWESTGTTFQQWTVSSDQSTTTEVDGPGNVNLATPSWYWNDQANATEVVKCTIGLTPPSGEGDAFSFTVSTTIKVVRPTYNWGIDPASIPIIENGKVVQTSTKGTIGFFDNSKIDGHYGATTLWDPVTMTVPSPFSGGKGCFVQLTNPSGSATRVPKGSGAATYTLQVRNAQGVYFTPAAKEKGLDGAFPYNNAYVLDSQGNFSDPPQSTDTSQFSVGSYTASGDSPEGEETPADIDSGGTAWNSGSLHDTFTTWLMFEPSGGTWVPLQKADWSVTGKASGGPSNFSATGSYSAPTATDTTQFPHWKTVMLNPQYRP